MPIFTEQADISCFLRFEKKIQFLIFSAAFFGNVYFVYINKLADSEVDC